MESEQAQAANVEQLGVMSRAADADASRSFAALYGSLDLRPEERGKQFERVVKWFLKNDPAWATQVEKVWLGTEWPERWGADCSIELILRHRNGEVWAVHAKCYSPDCTVTKHDVDRFLSESNRSLIHRRLLVATTDRIGANAMRVCEAQEKPVVLFRLSDFNNSLLDYPSDFAHLHQSLRRPPPVPRDRQNEAIAAVASGLRTADRGQLIMACGTGKTYVTLWVKEALNAQRTLVLVPSSSLLSQLLREWTHAASVPFDLLCVSSDDSVGSKSGDDAVHSVMDLAFRVASDAAEVRQFLCGGGSRVVISTSQSSLVVAAAQSEPGVPAFDLAIADEAHRCAGKVGGDCSPGRRGWNRVTRHLRAAIAIVRERSARPVQERPSSGRHRERQTFVPIDVVATVSAVSLPAIPYELRGGLKSSFDIIRMQVVRRARQRRFSPPSVACRCPAR